MLILEKDIESYLFKRVKQLKGLCLKLPANLYEGIPDRLVLLPKGRIGFAELKRPQDGRLEKLQPFWHKLLRELGFKVYIPKTKEEVEAMLDDLQRN